jgi:hypothetical protein
VTRETDTPLVEVLAALDAQGFQGQVRAVPGAVLECLTCHELIEADALDADRVTRLEGASDPADMLLVLPLECPHCHTRATFIANYGPESTIEDAEVLAALSRDAPGGDGPGATPGVF